MFKELIDIFNDEKLNKGSLKLERILLLVIPYFYFVFGLFFYKAPNIYDPMSLNQRAFGASIFLVLFILSFISEWVKKRLQTLINIAVYFAVIHLAYVAYLNSYDYDIAISLIVTIAIANLFFEWNEIILYCNIITSIFIGITLLFIEETIPFRISYFVIYLSIATFSYLISYQKSTMKNKLDIITNQQEMLLSNTDTQIWYLIDYDKYGKVNQAHANFLGVNKKEIENEKLDKFFNDEEAKVCKRKNKKVFKGKKKTKSKEWIRNKNNELRCLSITKIPKVNNKGSVEFVICSANDITEKIEKKEQLKLTQFSIDNAPVGVYWITPEGELDYANNKACRMLNYNKEELVGKKIFDIDPNYNSNQRNQFWENLKRINTKKLETKHKKKDGDLIPVQVIDKYIKYKGNEYEFAFVQDISDRKEIEEKLKYLSFNDQLTGLYNRRYFENEMDRLDESRKLPISIIIVDIDNLKFINDNYGHKIGDKYIKKAADIIENNLRKEDIAARIGGDEFAIILTNASQSTAVKIINRILDSTNNLIIHNGNELNISIGYATKVSPEENLESIFTKADKDMYEMKNNNINSY